MRKAGKNKGWLRVCFILYLTVLVFIVFLTPNRYLPPMRQYHFHILPLETTIDGLKGPRGQHFWPYWTEYFGNLIGNVLLFVPMGFLLKAIQPGTRNRYIILTGIAVSIGIELIQLLFKIGVCDVDDVILNTAGVLGGAWLFTCLKW